MRYFQILFSCFFIFLIHFGLEAQAIYSSQIKPDRLQIDDENSSACAMYALSFMQLRGSAQLPSHGETFLGTGLGFKHDFRDISSGSLKSVDLTYDNLVFRGPSASNQSSIFRMNKIEFYDTGTNMAEEKWTIEKDVTLQDPPTSNLDIKVSRVFPGGGASLNTLLRLHSNLNVGIGDITPSEKLDVNGSARFRIVGSGPSVNDLRLTSDGTLTTNTSDQRLKENIQTLSEALGKVTKLRGVSFTWKNDPNSGTQHGLIAQEVMEVVPELVHKNGEYFGVDYSELVGLFVEAFKEQKITIDAQKREIEQLKNQVASILNILNPATAQIDSK